MQEYKLIEFTKYFLENPYQEFYLREIARELKISPFAAKKYADKLVKENILLEEKKANLRYLKLNLSNLAAKHLKVSLNLKKITDSGLIGYLVENVKAISSIVLFGSVARGEDEATSDIDLLIIGKTKLGELNLNKFEEKIEKRIEEHVFTWAEWKKQEKNNKGFYFDIISEGIVLYGQMPIV